MPPMKAFWQQMPHDSFLPESIISLAPGFFTDTMVCSSLWKGLDYLSFLLVMP
jgi:hypothetical protein